LGQVDAQNNLGAMYLSGMGVNQDPAEAVYWYQKAAEQSQHHAQFNLAMLYLLGNGIEQNDEQAAYWLHTAAESGDIESMSQLGILYQQGRGVEQNFVIAAELHTVAAIEGHLASIDMLSEYQSEIENEALNGSVLAALCMVKIYDHGLGIEPDNAQVYAWLQWAKLHGTHDENDDELETVENYVRAIAQPADIDRGNKLLNEMRGRADEMI